jgi:hypothetical protein
LEVEVDLSVMTVGPEWNDAAFWRFWEKSSTLPVSTSAGSCVMMLFSPLSWPIPAREGTSHDGK